MQTRRDFLQQGTLATAGLLVMKGDWFKKSKETGLQLYTLRDQVGQDLKGTVGRIAAIGFTAVETFGYHEGKYFGLSTSDFATIFSQNNLKTPSGHYMLMDYLSKGDEDDLKKTVEDSRPLAHDYFAIPYLVDSLRTSLDDYKRLAERMNRAGEVVKEAGMKLAYHNHDFEFKDWGGGKTGYDILLTQTDPRLVNFEMDIFWVTKAGADPLKLMAANPGRFRMWHVKDMDNTPDKAFTEVGSGVINYKEIFKHRKQSGLAHFFVEQDVIHKDPFASISQSLEYIKSNLL